MKAFFTITVVLAFCFYAPGQSKKMTKAVSRVEKASDLITVFSKLGADSLPIDLLKKAKAIAIFPQIEQTDGLLSKGTKGNGVFIYKTDKGWGLPTFLNCRGIKMEIGRSIFFAKIKIDAIFLFMNDEGFDLISGWQLSDSKVRGKKLALGPIISGKGADSVIKEASVIYYTFEDQKLSGEEFLNERVANSLRLSHDDGLNKATYGRTFKQIRSSEPQNENLPNEILNLQKMMNETFKEGN